MRKYRLVAPSRMFYGNNSDGERFYLDDDGNHYASPKEGAFWYKAKEVDKLMEFRGDIIGKNIRLEERIAELEKVAAPFLKARQLGSSSVHARLLKTVEVAHDRVAELEVEVKRLRKRSDISVMNDAMDIIERNIYYRDGRMS